MKTFKELMQSLPEKKAMSFAQRRKVGIRMGRMARSSAFQAKLKRLRGKMATPEKLMRRARKQAKMLAIKKFGGVSAKNYAQMPASKRVQFDNRVLATKGAFIKKVAKKLLRTVRQKELERLKTFKKNQKEADK